jgi:monoamine oxidase
MLTKPVSDLEDILSGLHIEYGATVTSLSLNEDVWRVEDWNGNRREADKVIMTVPISVLGRIKITPAMSEKKRDALGRIGTGKLEKIWMLFEKRHWGDLSHFYLTEPGSLCNVYIDVSEICNQPALLTFVGNDRVEVVDRMSDSELLHSVLKEVEESGAFNLS